MKILSVINISNEQDLDCDSGFIFQQMLASELGKLGCTYHIVGADCPSFRKCSDKFFTKHYVSNGTNRFSSRYNFNFDQCQKLIEEIRPDLIFNSQIELTAAIKSVLEFSKINIPLVSYCHYPALWDNKNKKPLLDASLNNGNVGLNIVMNILSAISIADKVIIQSNFAKKLVEKALLYYKIPYPNKIAVIAPPLDNRIFCGENLYLSAEHQKSFLYNHRLYKSYGTEEFMRLSNEIFTDFSLQCNVFDSMPNRSSSRASINASPEYYKNILVQNSRFSIINGNTGREEYKKNLLKNLFGVAAFRKACVWSMASLDCLSLGIPVIAPNYAAYNEFIPQDLLFENDTEALIIIDKLINNDGFRNKMSRQSFGISKKFKSDIIAKKMLKLFIRLKEDKCAE